jgi:PAS domain S-box-containing protein
LTRNKSGRNLSTYLRQRGQTFVIKLNECDGRVIVLEYSIFKNAVARRLIGALLMFSSCITLLTTGFQLSLDYFRDVANIESSLDLVTVSHLTPITQGLWAFDEDLLGSQLDGLLAVPDIEFVKIERTGRAALSRGAQRSENIISRIYPIVYQGPENPLNLGRLEIVASLDNVYQRLFDKAFVVLISNGVKTFLVAGFLFWIFHYLVSRHLTRIGDFIRSFDLRNSDASLRLDKQDLQDEFDQIAGALNDMSSKLRRTEERYAFAMSGTNDGVWDWNITTGEVHLSPRWHEILGSEYKNLVNSLKTITSLLHPDDRDLFMKSMRRHLENRKPFQEEFRIRRNDGSYAWVLAKGQAVWDASGKAVRMAGSISDITKRKIAENAVQESETLLRSIIDNSPATISLRDLDGAVQLVNKAFLTTFNVTQEQAIGKKSETVLLSDHSESRTAHEEKVLQTGNAVTQERSGILPSGDVFHQLLTKFPVRGRYGEITGIGTIGVDLRELRKVENNLRSLENQFRDILRIAPEVIISTDEAGIIQVFNDAAESTFGYQREEMIGQPLDSLLPKGVRETHSHHLKAFVDGSETTRLMGRRGEISGRRRDGSIFPASASISKLQSDLQTILTVTLHDISERRQAEDDLRKALFEAERANQAKTEFLATMSHELRTPLNAIIGFSETMAGQYFGALGSSKYVEYAGDIKFSGEHLLNLINDLLDLSAIEAGKLQLNLESLKISDVVEDCLPIVTEGAERKEVKFIDDVQGDLPPINADRRALKQILLNLLSNATKFTPEGGKVTLKVGASGDDLIVEIRDTGVGIPADKLGSLTEPFERGEPDPHKAQEGTGLGLAIVKSLVELHDGNLTIESEVGVGTVVTVTLPLGEG